MERTTNGENGFMRPRGSASKNPAVSSLQDLLFYQLTGLGFYAKNVFDFHKYDDEVNDRVTRLLYLSNKNINFNIKILENAIKETFTLKNKMENFYKFLCKKNNVKLKKNRLSSLLIPGNSLGEMVSQANIINVRKSIKNTNFNVLSLKEIIRQSLVSSANYLERVKEHVKIPENIYFLLYEILDFLADDKANTETAKKNAMKAGELQTQVLELLINSYQKIYGQIERKKISVTLKKGAAILVAGEDISFLKNLLENTKDKDINVYTYGLLNYAHAFQNIRAYKNLAGIYEGKYGDFSADIESFPGVVVLTSGNLEGLTDIYRGRIFSVEDISMLGITKLDKNDFKPLINAAYDAIGVSEERKEKFWEIGFGVKETEKYFAQLGNSFKDNKLDKILIFLGCSEFMENKKYLQKVLKNYSDKTAFLAIDCLLLQKNLNKAKFPVTFNIGQFISLYSLIRLLFSLAGNLKVDINEIPMIITVNLKNPNSISALLMLLSLGIKNIRINSDLPVYLTDSLIKVFGKEYGLTKINEENIFGNIKASKFA